MYTSLKINEENIKNIKTNYFKINIRFYMGYSEYCNISIDTSDEKEALSALNDLSNLKNWFMEDSLNKLINSSLLKEYIKDDIFEINEENTEIRFEDDFSIVWINSTGSECSVDLI